MQPNVFVGKVVWVQPPDLKVSFPPLIRNSPVDAPVPMALQLVEVQLMVSEAFEHEPAPVQ